MLLVLNSLNVTWSWGTEPKNVAYLELKKETSSSPESPERNTVPAIP